MIIFIRHPEIQLFANFIERFADVELLRDRNDRITLVIPGDYFAQAFCDSDPFASNKALNKGSIWYNEHKVNEIGLNQDECFACIAHELGHMIDPNPRDPEHQQEHEIYADKIACDLGIGDSMVSALRKMIDYYQQHREGDENNVNIENLQDRIEALA